MTEKHKPQMDRIRRARMKLLKSQPFFGDLAFSFPILFDDTLNPPTACTDGETITFHPKLVDSLTDSELEFILSHEVMHPALMHNARCVGRDVGKWNYACDIVVNYLLLNDCVGSAPDWIVNHPDLYRKGGGKVEAIYDLLPDGDYPAGSACSGGKGSHDVVKQVKGNADDHAAAMRNRLHQAAQTAKKEGRLSGALEAFVDQMTTPLVTWQEKLRNFVMTTKGQDRTWTKPNRRYASTDIFLPGNDGERIGEIVWAIDCSGSTSDRMVGQCGAELNSIQEELRPEKIHVVYFDSEVKSMESFEPDEPVTAKVIGRGGTAFSPIFRYIEEQGIEPTCCIVATDLECSDYGPKPNYPVMWTVLDGGCYSKPPWGDVLHVK